MPVGRRSRTPNLILCVALWGTTHCASSGFYEDAFQGTRGAVDALRRSGPEVVDPNAVQELTEAAARGVREGMELPADLDAYAAQLSRHAVAAAVLGVSDGLNGGLSASVFTTVDGLTQRLGGDATHRGLAGAMIADATPGLERLTQAELTMLRRELALMLLETRRALAGTTVDLNNNLQATVRANGEVLSQQLEHEVMPALGRGMSHDLAPAVEVLTQHAALGASRGLQEGLRGGLTPALADLRNNLVHGPRSTQHAIWALTLLVIVLVIGLSTVAVLAARTARRMLRGRFRENAPRKVRPTIARFKGRRIRPSGMAP